MEPLKNIYNKQYFDILQQVLKSLNINTFDRIFKIENQFFQNLSLMERMKYLTDNINEILQNNDLSGFDILPKLKQELNNHPDYKPSIADLWLQEWFSRHGKSNPDKAIEGIKKMTDLITGEFAIRPFIIQNPIATLKKMESWSLDENLHVRRLASEGSRPTLPWGEKIVFLEKNPHLTLNILNNLKNDDSLYVKKSVANHWNSISKFAPDYFLLWANENIGNNIHTDWIIKHASRTLLKNKNPKAVKLFYNTNCTIQIKDFTLYHNEITMPQNIQIRATLYNPNSIAVKVRLEYVIYHLKQNNRLSPKVFKISERKLEPNETYNLEKKHNFKPISTRTYYSGKHKISLQINGIESNTISFNLNTNLI